MRPFINLFLSIGLPLSALFVVVATIYFSINYDFGQAIKLGTLTGFFAGVISSVVITGILLLLRKIPSTDIEESPYQSNIDDDIADEAVEEKLMLLMDRELAFEVAIHSIIDQNIGNVAEGDKHKGTMRISTPEQVINITISPLTRHTSQVEVNADVYNTSVQQIINYIKVKEHSFLQY